MSSIPMPPEQAKIEQRIERVPFSGCWIWMGYVDRDGYGRLGKIPAHRRAYEAEHGAIPVGLEIDHRCRVRCCVNPAHLEAVTRRVNILRSENHVAKNVLKTRCPQGHPYVIASRGFVRRVCRVCERAAQRRSYAKRVHL